MRLVLLSLLPIFLLVFFSGKQSDVPCIGKRVLLLTAHPDDECMFFSPTILALSKQSKLVYSLCLSTGDADGLGNLRKDELRHSLDVLGIPPNRSLVIDDPRLRDNMTLTWASEHVASVVADFIQKNSIDTVLTFDEQGISGHRNHMSLPHGVRQLRSHSSFQMATLVTVPVIQKYTGVLPALYYKFAVPSWFGIFKATDTFIATPSQYVTGVRAMLQHWTQLVWFRWLYISFSRYMWINTWKCVP